MTPRVRDLLIANVGVFFLQMTMPQVEQYLVFVPHLALLQPWTIVTYMFLHGGITHILFNMMALFFFGPQVEARLGSPRFTVLYFVGGISGALLSMVLAPGVAIIGASAGVFAVMLAFAMFWPRAEILIWGIIPVQARVLVLVTTILALWSGLMGSRGGVADFAHLGGYAGAFLYLKYLQHAAGTFRRKVDKSAPFSAVKGRTPPKVNLTGVHELNKEEVNRILDKISAEGMQSLTREERTFLAHFVPPDDRPQVS